MAATAGDDPHPTGSPIATGGNGIVVARQLRMLPAPVPLGGHTAMDKSRRNHAVGRTWSCKAASASCRGARDRKGRPGGGLGWWGSARQHQPGGEFRRHSVPIAHRLEPYTSSNLARTEEQVERRLIAAAGQLAVADLDVVDRCLVEQLGLATGPRGAWRRWRRTASRTVNATLTAAASDSPSMNSRSVAVGTVAKRVGVRRRPRAGRWWRATTHHACLVG
jgi:hypothetical protein